MTLKKAYDIIKISKQYSNHTKPSCDQKRFIMECERFKCNDCSNTYKNKSSLRRHINSVHLNQRYICGHCQKAYMRNIDFLKHRIHCHQSVILQQGPENIDRVAQGRTTTPKPVVSTRKENPQVRFDINTTID